MEELEKHHEAQLKDRDRFKELEKKIVNSIPICTHIFRR